jgi:hypothetical protein
MSTFASPTRQLAGQALSLTPAPSRILQRKCACGGTPLFGSECAECRKRRTTQAAPTLDSGFAPKTYHDGRPSRGLGPELRRTGGLAATFQEIANGEGGEMTTKGGDAGPTEKRGYFVPKDLDVIEACNYFHGESDCDFDSGEYKIGPITDPCCSKECTSQHEQQHVKDLGGPLSCCQRVADNIRARPNDKESFVRKYNQWRDGGARAWSECNAWGVSVRCAKKLISEKKCAGSRSECCKQLQVFLTQAEGRKQNFCEQTQTVPLCPFPIIPDFGPGPTLAEAPTLTSEQ